MGGCQDSCRGGSKENEMDLEKNAYEAAIREKAFKIQGTDDLEEGFLQLLKKIEYPDASVKVVLLLHP